ncbi:hypothetical protein [Actinoplanes sp. NPDC051859]|uniref:hypothetical protein n=1 Tax=Actinoplanes sp. NPDC051859 TaxID=3363909 RepID=UPI00378CC8BE
MARSTRWPWLPSSPRFPLTVAGHGRISHTYLRHTGRLVEMVGEEPGAWGLLFVTDARGRHWTLFSPDPEYTAMYAPAAHTFTLDFTLFATKFPG